MDAAIGAQMFCGYCPDPECRKQLFFPSYLSSSVECTNCGQHHEKSALREVKPVSDPGVALRSLIQNILISSAGVTKKCPESVKVKGLSNYKCKLISPLLTVYGLDRASGTVKPLREMGQGLIFDCSHLSDRSFQIEEENLNVAGYGIDRSGSKEYLKRTLEHIGSVTGQKDALVPIHADGDGHCLVHALSRALVGRELFWHPLMENLKDNLQKNIDRYKMQFQDFIDDVEWRSIIAEADPDYEPTDGEPLGLRNIHIFGLANVLRRPIILLDGEESISSKCHYGGVYLPALCSPEDCKNKEGTLNKPIVIAWSSSGRNHFVPLIGVKSAALPKISYGLMPVPWGVPQELMTHYIEFDDNAMCSVSGSKCLQDKYLQRLVSAMESKFLDLYGISPELVADVYQHIFKPSGVVGLSPQLVTESARVAVEEGRLYRCLTCNVVIKYSLSLDDSTLKPGGRLYEIAVSSHGRLRDDVTYRFPEQNNVICRYDKGRDKLVPTKESTTCKYCTGNLRLVNRDGTLKYFNGDRTTTPSTKGQCQCGYKHYWEGKEYDNVPERLKVLLEWNNTTKEDIVYWFQYESDPALNSNAYEVAQELIQKHFPGEFGSERLKERVVDQIFRQTIQREQNPVAQPSIGPDEPSVPSKIILTGEKTKSLHKEELGASNAEKVVRKRIEHGAPIQQKRGSSQPPSASKPSVPKCKPSPEKTPLPSTVQESVAQPLSSPASPSPTSPSPASPSPSKEKKIRLSAPNSLYTTVSLFENMTYHDLQEIIEQKLGVPKNMQIIRYGFPPRVLEEPNESQRDKPLPLQHGDRVLIDRKATKETPEVSAAAPTDFGASSSSGMRGAVRPGLVINDQSGSDEELQGTLPEVLAQSEALLSVLGQSALWELAQERRDLFRPNGVFYEKIKKECGTLVDGEHYRLFLFPDKKFSYCESQDELYLCLGNRHVPVQPLTSEMSSLEAGLEESLVEKTTFHTGEREIATLQGTGRKDSKVVAFSGKGRSLSDDQGNGTALQNSALAAVEVSAVRHDLPMETEKPPMIPEERARGDVGSYGGTQDRMNEGIARSISPHQDQMEIGSESGEAEQQGLTQPDDDLHAPTSAETPFSPEANITGIRRDDDVANRRTHEPKNNAGETPLSPMSPDPSELECADVASEAGLMTSADVASGLMKDIDTPGPAASKEQKGASMTVGASSDLVQSPVLKSLEEGMMDVDVIGCGSLKETDVSVDFSDVKMCDSAVDPGSSQLEDSQQEVDSGLTNPLEVGQVDTVHDN